MKVFNKLLFGMNPKSNVWGYLWEKEIAMWQITHEIIWYNPIKRLLLHSFWNKIFKTADATLKIPTPSLPEQFMTQKQKKTNAFMAKVSEFLSF